MYCSLDWQYIFLRQLFYCYAGWLQDFELKTYLWNFISGILDVITVPNVIGRVGGNVTIACNISGPEQISALWKKYTNSKEENIQEDRNKYSVGNIPSPDLTIYQLTMNDKGQYQCIASNPGGNYSSTDNATVNLRSKYTTDKW